MKNNHSTDFNPAYKLDPESDHGTLVDALEKGELPLGRHRLNVQIQTTSVCNGKCHFCPYVGSWHQKNPGLMGDEIYTSILENLTRFSIRKFCPYLENEPLTDPKLFDRIAQAREMLDPEWIEVSSNMALLNEDRQEKLINALADRPHEIWVSFHGINQSTYRDIMGLDFDTTLANVHRLVQAAQTTPLNIIIRGAGMPRVHLNDNLDWFGKEDYFAFWEKQMKPYEVKPRISFFTYHDRAGSPGLKQKGVNFGTTGRDMNGFYCPRFDRWAHFLYTGEPILCCMDYARETAFGDTIANADMNTLYSSEKYLSMLRKGTGMEESPAEFICRRCISPGG